MLDHLGYLCFKLRKVIFKVNAFKFWIEAAWFKNDIYNIENETLWILSRRIDDLFGEIKDRSIGFLMHESNV